MGRKRCPGDGSIVLSSDKVIVVGLAEKKDPHPLPDRYVSVITYYNSQNDTEPLLQLTLLSSSFWEGIIKMFFLLHEKVNHKLLITSRFHEMGNLYTFTFVFALCCKDVRSYSRIPSFFTMT